MRKPSRDRPSRKLPAIASRGAKPMECTRPSRPSQCWANSVKAPSIWLSSATSQGSTILLPNSAANSLTRSLKRSPT
ncbi:hypothetical protein G6F31_021135 [Rhizopus arrhizus]|nr:hypothetical protein G6F31_021135 [Rhizopus arrhizus]